MRINDNGVDRDMSEQELSEYKVVITDAKASKKALDAEQATKDAARVSAVAKLAALGLNEAEVLSIIGSA